MWQVGLLFGISTPDTKHFFAGMILNTGFVSAFSNQNSDPKIRSSGVVWVPQAYGELNVFKWLRLRIGRLMIFTIYTIASTLQNLNCKAFPIISDLFSEDS